MVVTSVIGRLVRSLCGAACIAVALLGTPAQAETDPLAETFAKADGELRTLRDEVAQAQQRLGTSGPGIAAQLAAFRADTAVIDRAVDLVPTLRNLSAALRQGEDASLRPMADAADRISAAVEAARTKAQLHGEAYGGADDPRYRQLVAQWGEAFANAATYAPTAAWDVFRPTVRPSDKTLDFALIWDEQESEWYRVDAAVPVETIFRDGSVGLGRRLSAGKLKYLAENFTQLQGSLTAATAFSVYLNEAAQDAQTPQGQAFARLSNGDHVLSSAREIATFGPKFIYDATFRATVVDALDHLRQDLIKQGAPAQASLRDLDALLRQSGFTLESQWAQGVIPANATVRVVAWFSDNPRNKFVSTWRFEKEKVTVEIDKGYAHGTRTGNMVQSDGSIPGRNCTATDEREFKDDGNLTFQAIYVCSLGDGSTQVNNVSGAGTWQIVAPPRPDGRNGKSGK